MNREQEIWAIALWLEKHYGGAAPDYIGKQVARLAAAGDTGGIALWKSVAERYDRLGDRPAAN